MHVLSIATKIVPAGPVRGILQGGHQVFSTILMYTEKRGHGTILVAIESTHVPAPRRFLSKPSAAYYVYLFLLFLCVFFCMYSWKAYVGKSPYKYTVSFIVIYDTPNPPKYTESTKYEIFCDSTKENRSSQLLFVERAALGNLRRRKKR